ncbi:MAG: tRNA (adenosine(37)-N6)-dimethylallyltransferase MiaA [Dehalococcoidia bacterium]|nr:tRNA (adenosine(37)-N6)-dimethylallyltransferase MiaA [Dehalococcoidia bacterium]
MGKSGLALTLARAFNGEIISADSRQVYRFMDVGTAKLSSEDRAEIRHHLIDNLDPDKDFSLALFLDMAHEAIQDVHARGKLPIVVGGTGQYVWALAEGWQVPHVPPDQRLRQELEERVSREGPDSLHRTLYEIDVETASKINSHNVRRVIRALETYYATGVAPSTLRR